LASRRNSRLILVSSSSVGGLIEGSIGAIDELQLLRQKKNNKHQAP
jgi:hypothetical protein